MIKELSVNKAGKIFLFCLLLSFLIVSCTSRNSSLTSNRDTGVISVSRPKKIIMPDKPQMFCTSEASREDSISDAKKPYCVLAFMNFSCPICIQNVDKWSDFYELKLKKFNIPLTLICQSDERFHLMKYLYRTKKVKSFSSPLLLDTQNTYMRLNPGIVSGSGEVKTVLIDSSYNILYAGNPLGDSKDEQELIKTIQSIKMDATSSSSR